MTKFYFALNIEDVQIWLWNEPRWCNKSIRIYNKKYNEI